VGRRGITVTPLRPIGRVRFGRDEVDVMSEGEYIEPNQEVEVMTAEGPRIVVRIPDTT
jgi:membrane-bound serine protease (ClpP class)